MANDPIDTALSDLTKQIEAKFTAVKHAETNIAPFTGFGLFAVPEPDTQPAQVADILAEIDWRFDGRADHEATEQATAANIAEVKARLLDLAAKDAENITDGGTLLWRERPTFIYERDVYTRQYLVGLIARGYVLGTV